MRKVARRRQQRVPQRSRKAAAGALTSLLAVVLGSAFLPGATGFSQMLLQWQRWLLGVAAVALPAYLLAAGLLLWAAGDRAKFSRRIAGLLVVSLVALMAAHARLAGRDLLGAGLSGEGGGAVGGALTWALASSFGQAGMWTGLVLLGLLGSGLLAGLSLRSTGFWLRRVARALILAIALLGRILVLTLLALTRVAARMWSAVARTAGLGMGRVALGARGMAAWLRTGARRLAFLIGPAVSRRPDELAVGEDLPEQLPLAEAGRAAAPQEPEAAPAETAASADAPPPPIRPAPPRHRARPTPGRPVSGDVTGELQERLQFASADYRLPPLSTLGDAGSSRPRGKVDPAETARALEHTLDSFGVKVRVIHWEVGPVVTRFEVQPEPGVKVQKITSLTNDIALNLAAQSVRIEAPIPGKSAVGIELPNQKASMVHVREILSSDLFQKATSPLVVCIGKDIAGHPIVADLAEMPHLLIAGATGSGKSVALNAMIASLLFRSTPAQVRLVMIDPKRVELTDYNEIPHLLTPVVTNPRQAASVLKDMLRVMEQRFERFAQVGVRNIQAYNQLTDVEPLYYIVVIVDELADLMMVAPADFEDIICRLAQMTRATGIHLVVATQRPSVDVITGLIKANIPSRLAFAVSSQVDSRTILDMAGAEKLLGRGDMLFLPLGASRPIRAQGAYIGDDEIRALVEWWRRQGEPVFDQQLAEAQRSTPADDSGDGERLFEAARLVVRTGYGSVSLLQRKMRIGYVTAARLIDELESRGVVGPVQGSNPREVLVGLDEIERLFRRRPQEGG